MNEIISQLFSTATADLNAFIFGDMVAAVSAIIGIILIITAFFVLKNLIFSAAHGYYHDGDDRDEYLDAEKLFMKEKRKERVRAMADRMHSGEDYRGDR
jgi:hypothetical protein